MKYSWTINLRTKSTCHKKHYCFSIKRPEKSNSWESPDLRNQHFEYKLLTQQRELAYIMPVSDHLTWWMRKSEISRMRNLWYKKQNINPLIEYLPTSSKRQNSRMNKRPYKRRKKRLMSKMVYRRTVFSFSFPFFPSFFHLLRTYAINKH